MPEIDLSEADQQILSLLKEGRNTPSNMADRLGFSREYVSQRLKRLREHGVVVRVDRGLYAHPDVEDYLDDYPPDLAPREDIADTDSSADDTSDDLRVDEPDSDRIEEALQGWKPGRDNDEREERRAAGRAGIEWLRDHGGYASGAEFKTSLYDEYAPAGQSEETFWRKTVRPALQKAEEAGLVEYRAGHHDYRWVADE